MNNKVAVEPLRVQEEEAEYQPINTTQRDGIQILSPIGRSEGHGSRRSGSPSLVWVLIKTYGAQFMVSVLFKVTSDLLKFANPLILK